MDASTWAEARRLVLVEKLKQQEAARMLGIDPRTVHRALAMERFEPKKLPPPRPRRIDPFRPRVEEILARRPSITAVLVREELLKDGFSGDVTIVRDLLREVRGRRPKPVYLRLSFLPGEACQVDWATCGSIRVGRTVRRLSCFVMVLCYSRALYLEFTLSERIETFLECHVNAFRFFGGVVKRAIYDNLKAVVAGRAGCEIRFNPRFAEFAGHYLLEPSACNPASGWEKGRVERAIQYIRESFLADRELKDLDEINAAAARWRDEIANLRVHEATGRRPIDLIEEERPLLRPLPAVPADTEATVSVRADAQFRVPYDGNLYSVPASLAHATLTLRAGTRRVRLFNGETLVAEHVRSYDRGQDIFLAEHARALLAAKRRGERDADVRRFVALGPPAERYLKGLLSAEGRASRHVVRLLRLVDRYGEAPVLDAIRRLVELKAFGASYVENLVEQDRRKRHLAAPLPLVLAKQPELQKLKLPPPDLAIYDRAFAVDTGIERPVTEPTSQKSRTNTEGEKHA